jgi:hypothetical protein
MNMNRNCTLPKNVEVRCDPQWCGRCEWAGIRTVEEAPEEKLRVDEEGLLIGLAWLQVVFLVLKVLGMPWPWWAALLPLEAVAGFAAVAALWGVIRNAVRLRRSEERREEVSGVAGRI